MPPFARYAGRLILPLLTLGGVVVLAFAGGGGMFSPGALSEQGRGRASLGGVGSHAEIGGNCSACHAPPWGGETMASRCLDCHAGVRKQIDGHGPMHGLLPDAGRCTRCHHEHNGRHAALTSLEEFHHDFAAFKLTGKHTGVACTSCHRDSVYRGTPQTCVSCHAEPGVHKGRLGTACAQCHSTSTWKEAAFAKDFDHNVSAFTLTGKHRTVACQLCHVKEVFKGTPQTCVSCHADPEKHKGRFGTACTQCHSTATWKDATFKHRFPLNHGRRGTAACATCHAQPSDYKAYTCYGCHAHQPAQTERRHLRIRNLGDLRSCARCHPTGRGHGRERAEGPLDWHEQVPLLTTQNLPEWGSCPAGEVRFSPANETSLRREARAGGPALARRAGVEDVPCEGSTLP